MTFDLKQMAFSKYGSYVSVTQEKDGNTFKMRNCRRLFGEEQFFDFWFTDTDGKILSPDVTAYPDHIEIKTENGIGEIILAGKEEILLRGKNLYILGKPTRGWCFQTDRNIYRNHVITDHNYTYDAVTAKGVMEADIKMERVNNYHQPGPAEYRIYPDENGELEFAVQCSAYEVEYHPDFSRFEQYREETRKEWEAFLAQKPCVAEHYEESSQWLWYNIWSSFITAGGNMKYDAVLMSKAYMCAVWSWDHCFNALALLESGNLKACLEQFFLIFETQSPEGKLPDFINTEVHWRAAVKPPVHGWCFGKIMDRVELPVPVLEKAYGHLEKWTNWHFRYRDTDHDGVPEYIMGNDSGWDNSTLFDIGTNMETPDLPAYLYLQMKTLERIAEKLGWKEQQECWQQREEKLLRDFLSHSWTGKGFVSRQSITHRSEETSTSLLALMPIVIGDSLPREITEYMVEEIKAHHLTEYGLATESIHSEKYLPNGYWRGPIWAPTTYLAVDGLAKSGYPELAQEIARRFCKTVCENGAYENFDALTGEGLCDKGYTWTSSAALCLMTEYAGKE